MNNNQKMNDPLSNQTNASTGDQNNFGNQNIQHSYGQNGPSPNLMGAYHAQNSGDIGNGQDHQGSNRLSS